MVGHHSAVLETVQRVPVGFGEPVVQQRGMAVWEAHQPGADVRQVVQLTALVEVEVVLHQVGSEQLLDRVGLGQAVDDQEQLALLVALFIKPGNGLQSAHVYLPNDQPFSVSETMIRTIRT
ncbi:hypothetical protein D9M69_562410 [compost metagenome]